MPDQDIKEETYDQNKTDSDPSESEESSPFSIKTGRRCASVERLKEETRLVLLDFLASLPPDKLTARNLTLSEHRPERLQQALRVAKSQSDASAYEMNRTRFQQMAAPLRRKLSLNLKREIENFNPTVGLRRKTLERPCEYRRESTLKARKRQKERPSKLELIPAKTSPTSYEYVIISTPVLSPEGRVAAMLDKIGQEVMESYPHLLDEPLELTRGWNFHEFDYEQFKKAARQVTIDSGLVGWSKVALLCYFAREITIETPTELTDKDLVKLAEYTVQFIDETTGEWMETQGGWAGLELEEEILTAESLAVKYREQEDSAELQKLKESRRTNRNSRDSGSWNTWAKYGIAALAVGVGVCYSLIRH